MATTTSASGRPLAPSGGQFGDHRVTAKLFRTDDGEVVTRYRVDGRTFHSAEAVADALRRPR